MFQERRDDTEMGKYIEKRNAVKSKMRQTKMCSWEKFGRVVNET